ncbi:MAG: DHA2 family efflux MFS transporter permease subunit [Acidobacteriota bacterium]|nr:DHA2 family efflux MFS transporter permease subunit [Acidobacteriota bacterium]
MNVDPQDAAPREAQGASPAEHAPWKPRANPWIIAASVMISTFMVVLDSSVANVALPHIAGNLSATNDEATWVLTSYLVSNAIMLPATGWLTRRLGRKRLLMSSIVLFTGASLLCGMAVNMPMLILSRILQGVGGGGMQPLAHATLLESFPPRQHGTAMAVYGVGVVVAPVVGPTLGGWITDSYSWRWIFYINLPVGLLALVMASLFIEDPPYLQRHAEESIDYQGFTLMALWLGSLQLILDKGQEADWFGAPWICWTAALSVLSFVGFIWRELTCHEPIVRLGVLKERNFSVGTVIAALYGFILYGSTALLPLFLQTLLGYPAMASGLSVSPRGVGAMISMSVAGMLSGYVDPRLTLSAGLGLFSISTLMLAHLNLGIAMSSVMLPNLINGFSSGLIFVPLTTMAIGHLRQQEIGNATGIYNLMRNIGGSVGIAVVSTMQVRHSQVHQNYLVAQLTGSSPRTRHLLHSMTAHFQSMGADPTTAAHRALVSLSSLAHQQALLLSYMDIFRMVGYLALVCVPATMLFERVARKPSPRRGSAK